MYIYERDINTNIWKLIDYITAFNASNDASIGDQFGSSVSLYKYNAIIGAIDSNTAYIYKIINESSDTIFPTNIPSVLPTVEPTYNPTDIPSVQTTLDTIDIDTQSYCCINYRLIEGRLIVILYILKIMVPITNRV